MRQQIVIRGAREHNLQGVNLEIPWGRWTAVCGVSGSGKTSLVIDTLFAEGQRRYLESLSVAARKNLPAWTRPDADLLEGLPPTVALASHLEARDPTETIAEVTEIDDHARLLYARLGQRSCAACGQPLQRASPATVVRRVEQLPPQTRYWIAAPFTVVSPEDLGERLSEFRRTGFARVLLGDRLVRLADLDQTQSSLAAGYAVPGGWLVIDRLTAGAGSRERLYDTLEGAFRQGLGRCTLLVPADLAGATGEIVRVEESLWRREEFSALARCPHCQTPWEPLEPRHFDPRTAQGACGRCEGRGMVAAAGKPPASPAGQRKRSTASSAASSTEVCPECGGQKLRAEALAVKRSDRSLAEFYALEVATAREFLGQWQLTPEEESLGRTLLDPILTRLDVLSRSGLAHLQLNRPWSTLSSGEAQRVALTAALASRLVNVLYVLDEPTRGLHLADVELMVPALQALRARGNTVIVVDHHRPLLRAADHLVELGPGAGEQGGQVTFTGTVEELVAPGRSLTGEFLSGRRGITASNSPRRQPRGWVTLAGAAGRNLQRQTVRFPLGVFCAVTGVSGAGKSSLVGGTLYPAVARRLGKDALEPLPLDSLAGEGAVEDVLYMDRAPVGRSPRSNPVTFLKAYDEIRQVFAETPEARSRGMTASHFSFNLENGRCPTCGGDGSLEVDMQFLAKVRMVCGDCQGSRFRREILEVRYRGLQIAEVLNLTAREAFQFFRGQIKLQEKLKRLLDVGLDYIRLGQPGHTLSGGESQRLKLAGQLAAARRGRTWFLIEEPSSGLHDADLGKLLECFEALLGIGHSLVVIDHHPRVVLAADHVIDLGPGGGPAGGRVVACGTPEEIRESPDSATGRVLNQWLAVQQLAVPTGCSR